MQDLRVKREPEKEEAFQGGSTEGEPERQEKPKRAEEPLIRTKPLGGKKGDGSTGGMKAAEAPVLGLKGFGRRAQEWKWERQLFHDHR
jgi:hypothetical protein